MSDPTRESIPDEVLHRGLHGDLRVSQPPATSLRPRLASSLAWLTAIGTICLVVMSALPAIARGMGVTRVRVVQRESPHSAPIGRTGSDAVRDFEKDIGKSIEKHEKAPPGFEFAPDDKLDVAKLERDIVLRVSPLRGATPLGTVKRGTLVIVTRREGGWAQIMYEISEDSFEMGWVEERDLAP